MIRQTRIDTWYGLRAQGPTSRHGISELKLQPAGVDQYKPYSFCVWSISTGDEATHVKFDFKALGLELIFDSVSIYRSSSGPCPRLPQVRMRAGRRTISCGSLADRRRRTPRMSGVATCFPFSGHAVVPTGSRARASSDSQARTRVPMDCPPDRLPRRRTPPWVREASTAGRSSGRRSRTWMRNFA